MEKCPCYKCDSREVGCHEKCMKYKKYMDKRQDIKEKLKWYKVINSVTWI